MNKKKWRVVIVGVLCFPLTLLIAVVALMAWYLGKLLDWKEGTLD